MNTLVYVVRPMREPASLHVSVIPVLLSIDDLFSIVHAEVYSLMYAYAYSL